MMNDSDINIRDCMDGVQQTVHDNFNAGTWLASPEHVEKLLMLTTYYRKNLHRFAKDYLGLTLFWYQSILLFLMGRCHVIVAVAARASAKSWIIAVYSVCVCILYPGSMGVIVSGTKGQSILVISKKIERELMRDSPNLRREVKRVHVDKNEGIVEFHNGSSISAVTLGLSALGNRSTFNIYEEAKTCKKQEIDEYISPFKIVRQAPYLKRPEYSSNKELLEEPKDIYISSSIPEQHWLYGLAKTVAKAMDKDKGSMFFATDYSVTLKHGIRTRNQLIREKKKLDPITWAVEYENSVLRENTNAFFTYDMLSQCQVLKNAFYPRASEDVIGKVKNKFAIPKQSKEIRIIAADIAMVNRKINDNSVFSCLRVFPETIEVGDREYKDFRIKLPYLESQRGDRADRQAIRIRQLFEDFDADFIVLDTRNGGVTVLDELGKILYDDERGKEYSPLKAMNDDDLAKRCSHPDAEPIIYAVNASARFNNDIAFNLKNLLASNKLDLLVDKEEGMEEIIKHIGSALIEGDPETQLFFERPYLETKLLIAEMLRLEYEKLENTGLVRLKERGMEMKDRYTSVAYGCWFAYMLVLDNFTEDTEEYLNISCVSKLDL